MDKEYENALPYAYKDSRKTYEIALSYAHKDSKIARMIGEELDFIFARKFFMDVLRPEAIAIANSFRETLKGIFRNSNYAVVLYSSNYSEGKFTPLELQEILKKREPGKEAQFFIINMDDCRKIDDDIYDHIYSILNVYGDTAAGDCTKMEFCQPNWEAVRDQIYDIVHNSIKRKMIIQTISQKERGEAYSLRVQTMCPYANTFQWDQNYDWNILGKAFINEDDGKCLKPNTSWEDFWKYISADFKWIKEKLSDLPDVKWRIHLNCHLSIAYKLGQLYGELKQASGNRNLVLTASKQDQRDGFAFSRIVHNVEIKDFCKQYDGNCCNSADIVCIISIKPKGLGDILTTVQEYMETEQKKYCKAYLFQEKRMITDADTLESMAEYLLEKMVKCRTGSGCKIHLFTDTAAPLMFVLGTRSVFPGDVQLYEYIQDGDTYKESLTK